MNVKLVAESCRILPNKLEEPEFYNFIKKALSKKGKKLIKDRVLAYLNFEDQGMAKYETNNKMNALPPDKA